jgi:purine-binding chemotaxis protein CheW
VERSDATQSRGPLRLVCFELRGQELALPIADVRETLPIQPITRVVLTPPCLAGVFSLRGDIVPVIDLSVLLGMPRIDIGDESRIVVVDHVPVGGSGSTFGIVVDRLRDLRTLDVVLEPPPSNLTATVAQLLLGVAATTTGTVRVLDARAILAAEPLRALARSEDEEKSA